MKPQSVLRITLLLAFAVNSQTVVCQAIWYEKVMQVKPGISTKKDVESLFDSPVSKDLDRYDGFEQGYYDTKWGRIFVNYSVGTCAEGPSKYDFEGDTVMYLSFSPNKPVKMSKLNINLDGFETAKEDDTPNIHHKHPDGGMVFTSVRGKLKSVKLSLTRDQLENHLCVKK